MPLVIKSAEKKIFGGKIMKMKSFSSFLGELVQCSERNSNVKFVTSLLYKHYMILFVLGRYFLK